MTDLISSLADSIIALINSKPASPTKEEVASVVHAQLADAVLGLGSYPFFKPAKDHAEKLKREREFLTQKIAGSAVTHVSVGADLSEASLSRAIEEITVNWYSHLKVDCQGEAPACPGASDGAHAYSYAINEDGFRCGRCGGLRKP